MHLAATCEHLHDSTTRYDIATKALTFLVVCPTCGIERVVDTLEYEPRPVWTTSNRAQVRWCGAGEVIGNPDSLAQAHLAARLAVPFYDSAESNAVDQQTDRSYQDGE